MRLQVCAGCGIHIDMERAGCRTCKARARMRALRPRKRKPDPPLVMPTMLIDEEGKLTGETVEDWARKVVAGMSSQDLALIAEVELVFEKAFVPRRNLRRAA